MIDPIGDFAARLFRNTSIEVCDAAEVPPEERYWVIPGRAGPRWMVPQDCLSGWPALRHWRPFDPISRVKWSLLTAAYRAGRLGLVPGVVGIGITGSSCSSWREMGVEGTIAPQPTVYVGTPGAYRKAVAFLSEPGEGRLRAVVKVPITMASAQSIVHEAEVLRELHAFRPGVGPQLLFMDPSTATTAQQAVYGKADGLEIRSVHVEWLTGLRLPGESTSLRSEARRLAEATRTVEGIGALNREFLTDLLDDLSDDTELPSVWVHGDFAFYNWKRTCGGALAVVDWEHCRRGGLPAYDLIHSGYVRAFLRGGIWNSAGSWQRWRRALNDYVSTMRIPTRVLNGVERYYMINECVSRLTASGGDAFSDHLLWRLNTAAHLHS